MSLRVPSTMQRQVTCNTLNNSGDGALTMVPLCMGLSGTEFTLGGQWKSRGQVVQTMDVTRGLIYYLYLPDDSEDDAAYAINSLLIVMSHKDSSQMTKRCRVVSHS